MVLCFSIEFMYCFAPYVRFHYLTNSAVKGRIWLKFELIRDLMAILVTLKYEEDPIKIEGARVATTQNNDFSNTQGHLTPQSEVGSS